MSKVRFLVVLSLSLIMMYGCNTKSGSEQQLGTTQIEKEAVVSDVLIQDETAVEFNTEQIMHSALSGELKRIEDVLEKGFDVNSIDLNQQTMLILTNKPC